MNTLGAVYAVYAKFLAGADNKLLVALTLEKTFLENI
jgi:hypothetical protein